MVSMPILAEKELHQAEPADVAAGVFARRDIRLGMADAVDEALGMEREDQSNRSQPKKSGPSPVESAEERQREHRRLQVIPDAVRRPVEFRAEARDRRQLVRLPQPTQMRPEEAMPRTRNICVSIDIGVMKTMTRDPLHRRAGPIRQRQHGQNHPRHSIEP